MNDQMKNGFIGAVIGGIVVWLLLTTVLQSPNIGMMNWSSNTQDVTQKAVGLDAHFIEQMIPHHEDAITMAKIAQTKAQRSEVRVLANNIIDSQGKEIIQMEAWYKTWFGKEVPKGNTITG